LGALFKEWVRAYGIRSYWRTHVFSARPESTARHKRRIFIAEIAKHDLPSFHKAVTTVKPDNSTVHWNSQGYVLEILEQLEKEYVINKEDHEYQETKKEVKSHFDPIL
jgi:hypothetical protein